MGKWFFKSFGATLAVFWALSAHSAVSLTKLNEKDIEFEGCSGIAFAGNGDFYIVQDHDANGNPMLLPVAIDINRTSGKINSVQFSAGLKLNGTGDAEGVAYDPCSKCVWVSDESSPPKIQEFLPILGAASLTAKRSATVPAIYSKCRGNAKLEALTMSRDGLTLWTANEEALTVDGAESSSDNGTIVRLTRFVRARATDNWTASGQWAYACEKAGTSTITSRHQCGLSGLCALPDGSLLVLEREVSESTWGRCSIYRLTASAFSAATDVTTFAALEGATYTKLSKGSALLSFKGGSWGSILCYEGICLGPKLSDGSYSVLLVSDGQTETKKVLFLEIKAVTVSCICALKLSGIEETIPEYEEGPTLPADQGVLDVRDGVAVVTPASGVRRIAITGAETLTRLVIPPQVEHVTGVLPDKIAVRSYERDITGAFTIAGGLSGVDVALNPLGVVRVGDETITTIPELSAVGGGQDRPFAVSAGGVGVGVRTIPGLVYRLQRRIDVRGGAEAVDRGSSGGTRLLLHDTNPPVDKAFYRVDVSVE